MNAYNRVEHRATVRVENVGGIGGSEVTFTPGVTVLEGENATNRTSFLRAIMAALGSDDVSIKEDADEARVELALGDETYTRTLRRNGQGTTSDGEPYFADSTLADLFGFLLETNETRPTIAGGHDLRELVMRPVDTDAIQARIDRLEAERRGVAGELEELADRVLELERELEDVDEEIAAALRGDDGSVTDRLAEREVVCWPCGSDVERTQIEGTLDRLRELRREKLSTRTELQDETSDLESGRETTEERRRCEPLEERIERIEAELDRREETVEALRERRSPGSRRDETRRYLQ